ncbi:hypothetical protein V5O48_017796, partial [Marasmius crinis-equi]
GRVLYISHRIAKYTERPVSKLYKTVVSASIESGLIYPITLALFTIVMLASYGIRLSVSRCGTSPECVHELEKDIAKLDVLDLCSQILHSCLVPVM